MLLSATVQKMLQAGLNPVDLKSGQLVIFAVYFLIRLTFSLALKLSRAGRHDALKVIWYEKETNNNL